MTRIHLLGGLAAVLALIVTAAVLAPALDAPVLAGKYKYPAAEMVDVSDDYHGTVVADPYRWLEDPDSKETMEWVEEQNRLTRNYIDSYDGRKSIEAWMTKKWDYPRYTLPEKKGDRLPPS